MNTSVEDTEYRQFDAGEVISRNNRQKRLEERQKRLDELRRFADAIYDPQWMNDDHYFSKLHDLQGGKLN